MTSRTLVRYDLTLTMSDWALRNKMELNAKKTIDMWICFRDAIPGPPSLMIDDYAIERVNSFKLIGLHVNNTPNWTPTLMKS